MILKPIEKRSGLNRATFKEEYLAPRKPVVFTDLMDAWPAKEKWNIDYLIQEHGHIEVPVYSSDYSKAGDKYMAPDRYITFGAYLRMIEEGPTDLRMFLFNIFKHVPEMCHDFSTPTIMDGFVDSFPFMFFGGEGAVVNMHYDIDLSHVFLNQFHGRKKIILFPPEQSKNIYHQPFTVASSVDVSAPDYENYPALRKAEGYVCILEPGESIFMPSAFWHHITYLDASYSISLRANDSLVTRAMGALNIAKHFVVDRGLNKIMGSNWKRYKVDAAKRRAEEDAHV